MMAFMSLWIGQGRRKKIEAFKKAHIYPTIIQTEIEEKSMSSWLATLPIHDYNATSQEQNAVNHKVESRVQSDYGGDSD